jgi:hypothetical protein
MAGFKTLRLMKNTRLRLAKFVAAVCLFLPSISYAGFSEDLAQCVKAPIDITTASLTDGIKTASFIINHSECVPNVIAIDPVLVGMTAGVVGLQNAPTPANIRLPTGADACTTAIFSVAKKPIAGMIAAAADAPPVSFIIPMNSKTKLLSIANGASEDALYQVPGVAQLTQNLSCACAVAETGDPVGKVKQSIEISLEVIKSAGACGSVVGKLFSGGYDAAVAGGEAVAGAISDTLTFLYGSFSEGVKQVGCTFGISSCSSSSAQQGPPYFCTGYMVSRGQGQSRVQIIEFWGKILNSHASVSGGFNTQSGWTGSSGWPNANADKPAPPNPYEATINACETEYQAALAEEARKKLLIEQTEVAEHMADVFALKFAFGWSPKCNGDTMCLTGISTLADQFGADLKDAETLGKYGYFSTAVLETDKKYSNNAQIAVWLATDRRNKALRDNPLAPVAARLPAFGCRPFLGRAGQSLCSSTEGLNVCKQYVRTNVWKLCASSTTPGAFYSGGAALDEIMKGGGCILVPPTARAPSTPNTNENRVMQSQPNARQNANQANNAALLGGLLAMGGIEAPHAYQCISKSAYDNCQRMRSGGSPVDCGQTRPIALISLAPITYRAENTLPPSLPNSAVNLPAVTTARPKLMPMLKRTPQPTPPAPTPNSRKP